MDPMLAALPKNPGVDHLENGKGLRLSSVPTLVSVFSDFPSLSFSVLSSFAHDTILTAIARFLLDPW
jgi:hypothetical protein